MNREILFLYISPLLFASILLGLLAYFIWCHRTVQGAVPLIILSLAAGEWSLGYALELVTAQSSIAIVFAKLQYLGIATLPVAWLIFALLYSGHAQRVNWITVALLSICPLITIGLVWTNEAHHLIWPSITLNQSGPIPILHFEHGLGFWVYNLYAHACLLAGSVVLVRGFLGAPRIYMRQVLALVIAIAAPWISNILYVTHLLSVTLDLTPFAFTIAALVTTLGIWRYRFLDIVPFARERVVDRIPECILVLDAQGRIADCNPAALHFINADAAVLIGRPVAQVFANWPELYAGALATTDQHIEVVVAYAGAAKTLDLNVTQLYDRRRQIDGRLMTWRDISALKQTEAALRSYNEELIGLQAALLQTKNAAEQANRAKSTFLANMSHELRTPLTAILGYAHLMRLQIDAAGLNMFTNDLDAVESSGLHLLQLINSLLDLAKLEAGRMELHIEEIQINRLIDDIVLTAQPLVAKNNNRLLIEPIAGDDHVFGDKTKIYQVLLNLIGNAAKFTKQGTIIVRVQRNTSADHPGSPAAPSASPADWLRFEIIDTGIGIAPEQMLLLFDAFTQANSAIAHTYGGTGLGLKICQHLCRLMHGEISVTSAIDHGSTFVVEIPAALDAALAAVDP